MQRQGHKLWLELASFALLIGLLMVPLAWAQRDDKPQPSEPTMNPEHKREKIEVATLGGGCFWCIEALYETLDGVIQVESGYAGGHVENPTYQQVIGKQTGHAEVVQITYDADVVSYAEILDFFWIAHDPTTLNRQGNDVGPQYRSIILTHNDEQAQIAAQSKAQAEAARRYPDPIVTEIVPLEKFYRAEGYHQDYYANNRDQPYCRYVIAPKLKKLEKATE